jgi:hypothetical protein
VDSDSLVEAKKGLVEEVVGNLAVAGRPSLREDLERIVQIAEELFLAIERQNSLAEAEAVIACGEQARPLVEVALKVRLRTCAMRFDASLQEFALSLTQHSSEGRLT